MYIDLRDLLFGNRRMVSTDDEAREVPRPAGDASPAKTPSRREARSRSRGRSSGRTPPTSSSTKKAASSKKRSRSESALVQKFNQLVSSIEGLKARPPTRRRTKSARRADISSGEKCSIQPIDSLGHNLGSRKK